MRGGRPGSVRGLGRTPRHDPARCARAEADAAVVDLVDDHTGVRAAPLVKVRVRVRVRVRARVGVSG